MIKNCFLLIFLGLFLSGFCQDKEQWGIKAGFNYAELFGDDALPESDRKEGYSIGGYANFKLKQNLKLQTEAIWSLQGEKSKTSGRYKISYINIPVLLKFTNQKFYTEVGPQLGILTINSSKDIPPAIQLTNFETFEVAVCGGVGYQLFDDFAFGLRYWQGLTNLVNGMNLKNSVFYIGISYQIF